MKVSLKTEQAITALGSFLLHTASGITTIWGSANIYYLSYFHNQGDSVSNNTNSFILISIIIPLSLSLLFANRLCEALGFTRTIRALSITFFFSQIPIYFTFSFIPFLIFTIIIPACSITVSLIPTMNLLWSHFSEKKSICTALNIVFVGCGNIFWNLAFVGLVNPKNEQAVINEEGNAYFSKQITDRLQNATKLIMFFCSMTYLAGALLVRENIKEDSSYDSNPAKDHLPLQQQTDQNLEKKSGSEEQINQTDLKIGNPSQVVQILRTQRCYLLFMLVVAIDVYPIYVLNNFKVIYLPIYNDDHFLAVCIIICTVSNIVGTFLWGYLAQKFGNITTMIFIVTVSLISGILGFFSKTSLILIIYIVFIGLADRGMETVTGPALVEIFGLKTATMLLPYKGLSLIIGFLFAPVIQLMTARLFNPFEELNFLSLFSLISCVIGYYYAQKYRHYDLARQHNMETKEEVKKQYTLQMNAASSLDTH